MNDKEVGPVAPDTGEPRRFELGDVEALLRLAVGAGALGLDELVTRLRKWDEQVMSAQPGASAAPLETDAVRVRYALVGALFSLTKSAADALNGAVNYSGRQSTAVYRQLDDLSRAPVLGLFARPVKNAIDATTRRRDEEIERLIRIGRVEERDGRRLAAVATDELLAELIKRVGNDPAVMELVQQQGFDLAGGMVDELREGTLDADDRLEGIVWRLLRRKPRALASPGSDGKGGAQ